MRTTQARTMIRDPRAGDRGLGAAAKDIVPPMAERPPDHAGGPQLRTIAMPRDANASGDIFGGWTLSQMDLAGAGFAAERAQGRVATIAIEAMRFLRPVLVGDEV